MGASILWKPVRNEGIALPVGGRSSFIEALREVFSNEPWTFTGDDIKVLRGIGAGTKEREAISDLIEAIEKHGSVEVFVQY